MTMSSRQAAGTSRSVTTTHATFSGAPTIAELKGRLASTGGPGPETSPREDSTRQAAPEDDAWPRLVVVVGTHPGVGATSLALFLADALRIKGIAVSVHQATDADETTLRSASTAAGSRGVHARVRGDIGIQTSDPASLAAASVRTSRDAGTIHIVDAGNLRAGESRWQPWLELGVLGRVVVVTEASVPGLLRSEATLNELTRVDAVVAVGARRWPPAALASAGPTFMAARAAGLCHLIPRSRRLAEEGLDDRPAPVTVAHAVDGLLRRLHSPSTHLANGLDRGLDRGMDRGMDGGMDGRPDAQRGRDSTESTWPGEKVTPRRRRSGAGRSRSGGRR
jgi:hypothetical protein